MTQREMTEETKELMEALPEVAKALSRVLNEVTGQRVFFTLMVNGKDFDTYVSNMPRDQCIGPIKKLLSVLESGQLDEPPSSAVH